MYLGCTEFIAEMRPLQCSTKSCKYCVSCADTRYAFHNPISAASGNSVALFVVITLLVSKMPDAICHGPRAMAQLNVHLDVLKLVFC